MAGKNNRGKKLFRFFAFFLPFVLFGFLVTNNANANGNATLLLSPNTQTVKTGAEFTLTVQVNPNGESLDTVRVNISFPAALLEVKGFKLGTLFPNALPGNSIDNSSGTVVQGAFSFDPVTKSGAFGTLTFRALSAGKATVAVTASSRAISDGEEKIDTNNLGQATITISGTGVAPSVSTGKPATAEEYFKRLAGRTPTSSTEDQKALDCMKTDSCYNPAARDLPAEKEAVATFISKLGYSPSASADWYAVHAVAYTDFLSPGATTSTQETAKKEEPKPTTSTETKKEQTAEDKALVYYTKLKDALPSTEEEKTALKCIAYDTCFAADNRNLAYEVDAIGFFKLKMKYSPGSSTSSDPTMDWYAVHAIAYTEVFKKHPQPTSTPPATTTSQEQKKEEPAKQETSSEAPKQEVKTDQPSAEQQALVYYTKLKGSLPKTDQEWSALKCIAYDTCKPAVQNVAYEQEAITFFQNKMKYSPKVSMDWYAVHSIAYTNVFIQHAPATTSEQSSPSQSTETKKEEPIAQESTPSVATKEQSVEEQALVYYTKLAGALPSTSEQWAAHGCIAYDTCFDPANRNLQYETEAIAFFKTKMKYSPKANMDWYAVHAIAYTNVFVKH